MVVFLAFGSTGVGPCVNGVALELELGESNIRFTMVKTNCEIAYALQV